MTARKRGPGTPPPAGEAANPGGLREVLGREIERSRRNGQPFTLACLGFGGTGGPGIRTGREEGGAPLRRLAGAVSENLRASDLVAPLGGDEIGLLLPETGEAAADEALGRLRKKILEFAVEAAPRLTVSIGAVTFWRMPGSPDEAIRLAAEAMRAARRAGRNSIRRETLGA